MTEINKIAKFKSLGNTGLKQSGGFILEELDNRLKGSKKYKAFKEMAENDAVIGAILFTIDNLAKTSKWSFKGEGEWVEKLNKNIKELDCTWEEVISEILSMLTYGYSFHEIVYKRDEDGSIVWKGFPIRSQDTLWEWEFTENGEVTAFVQNDPNFTGKTNVIPMEKGLLFRPSSYKNNPEGRSILRSAFGAYIAKKHIMNIEAVGIERNLAGIPVAYIPAEIIAAAEDGDESAQAMYNTFKEVVTNIRQDEQAGLVMPQQYTEEGKEMYKLDLLSGNTGKTIDTNVVIERYDQRIAASVLADLIFLGSGASAGSWAIGSTKQGMLNGAINNFLDAIAAVFNRYAVPRLMKLNGVPKDEWPTLTHTSMQGVDLNALSRFVQRVAAAGIEFTDEEGEQLKDLIGANQDQSTGTESLYESAGGSHDKLA